MKGKLLQRQRRRELQDVMGRLSEIIVREFADCDMEFVLFMQHGNLVCSMSSLEDVEAVRVMCDGGLRHLTRYDS